MDNVWIENMYNRNINNIYKICFLYFKGNKADIEDAIQTIFLKVIEKKPEFQDLNHEKAWIITVTNNYCKNKVKHWWNKNIELDFDIKDESKEDETLIKILSLPSKLKIPLYLFYYEGYSCVEIAKMLNTKENTVYSYLHKGRSILKEEIMEEYNE